jgi:hypothetical protein
LAAEASSAESRRPSSPWQSSSRPLMYRSTMLQRSQIDKPQGC